MRHKEHSNHSPDSVRHMWVLIVVEVVVTPVRPVRALRSPKTIPHRVKCRKQVARNEREQDKQSATAPTQNDTADDIKYSIFHLLPPSQVNPPPPLILKLISYYSKQHMSRQRPSFPKANPFSLSLLLLPSWNFVHFQAVRVKLRPGQDRRQDGTDRSSVVSTRLETLQNEWEMENVRTR